MVIFLRPRNSSDSVAQLQLGRTQKQAHGVLCESSRPHPAFLDGASDGVLAMGAFVETVLGEMCVVRHGETRQDVGGHPAG